MRRCAWPGEDPLNVAYHDAEWGRPVRSRSRLFEAITLEGAQAGLSWLTILRKRAGYHAAFAGFDPERVARFGSGEVERLLANPAIVRHRGKIESTIENARRIVALEEAGTPFEQLVWEVVGHAPIVNHWRSLAEVPSVSAESKTLSRRLKQLGFRFVGPTTCYAFMQAAGLVNDHETGCFCHPARSGNN